MTLPTRYVILDKGVDPELLIIAYLSWLATNAREKGMNVTETL